MHSYEVLRRPLITEKNTMLVEQNKYAFEVARNANKPQIKDAVEKAFKVKVASVNVMCVPGKMRRAGRQRGMTSPWKKAVVTLEPGHKIELFEGI
ncbi:MAG: 50S ribosomal protein L23 [Dehalococcoidia bacterium]|jgi:large subunit ribosomal protein L23|nr:MAG: 50S ribosomal protein L23 [Dehalococcoidia bacterium]